MDLPVTEVLRPDTLDRALELLHADPPPVPLAGGTDLVVQLRARRREAPVLLDLSGLPLDDIREEGGHVVIGATATMESIAASGVVREAAPALAEAAGRVGAWPIQCRATLGGNLANASPAADTAPPLIAAGAEAVLASAWGRRTVAIEAFFTGPGRTVLEPGELLLEVRVPRLSRLPGARAVDRFVKLGPRREQIISVVSLALRTGVTAAGALERCRIAVGSVAATPVRAHHAEAVLEGRIPDEALRREAVRALQRDIAPIDDVRAPARYRRLTAAVLLDRLLQEATRG